MMLPASAQSWNSWDTRSTISGVLGVANAAIESAERRKEMEIMARQKVEFEQSFQDAMTEAKAYEQQENWEEALEKYEEAAKLNCKYGYTDQHGLSRKITSLYVKGGREDDGPSILHNDQTILPDYSQYRYVRENPVYVNKKQTGTMLAYGFGKSELLQRSLVYGNSAVILGMLLSVALAAVLQRIIRIVIGSLFLVQSEHFAFYGKEFILLFKHFRLSLTLFS
jgi:hypothetical protein